jgi:type I restriction enzyme S subunit
MASNGINGVYVADIPEDWETVQMGELVSRKNIRYSDIPSDDLIPVYSVTNDDGFVPSDDQFDRTVYSEEVGDYKVVEKGQFAYNPSRIDVGSIALHNEEHPVLISPMYEVFEPNSEISKEYLDFVVHTEWARKVYQAYSQGSVRKTLKFGLFEDIPVPLPPKNERNWIVDDVLPTFENTVLKTERIISATQQVRDGVLQGLFTDIAKSEDFTEESLGPFNLQVPREWSIKPLQDVNDASRPICYGVVKPGEDTEGGVPLLNVENIAEHEDIDFESLDKISEGKHQEYSRSKISGGEVLITVRASVGEVVQVPENIGEANISRGLARISPIEPHDPRWIRYCLQAPVYQKLMDIYASGSTYSQLNIGELRDIPIILPPPETQNSVANRIENIDKKIKDEQKRYEALVEITTSVKHDLLVGNVQMKTPVD